MSSGLLSVLETDMFFDGLPKYYQHVQSLFESVKCFSYSAEFARLAIEALSLSDDESITIPKSELLSRLFTSELQTGRFDSAYSALSQYNDLALQKSGMTSLVTALFTSPSAAGNASSRMQQLLRLPLGLDPKLSQHVDEALAALANEQSGSSSAYGTPQDYLKILQTYRLARNDFRGATSVVFERLDRVRRSPLVRNDPESRELRQSLLSLINLLSCVEPDDAYILAEAPAEGDDQVDGADEQADAVTGWKRRRRIIVTLDDLRKEYQAILDHCSQIERGDYAIGLDDGGENEDEEMDTGEDLPHVNGSGPVIR